MHWISAPQDRGQWWALEHDNESLCCLKGREFFEYLRVSISFSRRILNYGIGWFLILKLVQITFHLGNYLFFIHFDFSFLGSVRFMSYISTYIWFDGYDKEI